MSFLRKAAIEFVNLVCNNRLFFFLAKKRGWFDAVFVMYPADRRFADHFTFRLRQKCIRWKPYIIGMIVHPSGKRTLMFAISAYVDQMDTKEEAENLRTLYERSFGIKESLGAQSLHFAGTLPGRFVFLRINRKNDKYNERSATQINVVKAIESLRQELLHGSSNPVVVLGANGYIGKAVTFSLLEKGVHVIPVDKTATTPYRKPCIPYLLVNITGPEAINEYIDPRLMGEDTVVLNEVYPAPHADIVKDIRSLGASVYHIQGVKSATVPPFPGAYQGAIPCCAALATEEYEVSIAQL